MNECKLKWWGENEVERKDSQGIEKLWEKGLE